MTKGYKFLEHTADIMFEASASTVEGLFEQCALAIEAIMVKLETVKTTEHYKIMLEAEGLEGLLYDFLSELIFVKDTEGWLFKRFEIVIKNKKKKYTLSAKCDGEHIDRDRHAFLDDAKAITKHEFAITQEKKMWKARVIVDV